METKRLGSGVSVITPDGTGKIVSVNMVAGTVVVELDYTYPVEYKLEEVQIDED